MKIISNNIWPNLQGIEFRQTFLDVEGRRTRIMEAGVGPPLILLHGTGGHAEAYARNIAGLSKDFRVIAYDMVGHGYTDAPDIDYSMQEYVDHLKALINKLGFAQVHLSGESLGGSVCCWFAQQFPQYVDKLVLNTGIPIQPEESGKKQLAAVLDRTRVAVGAPSREAMRARLEWLLHDKSMVTDELIDCRMGIYHQPGRAEIIKRLTERAIGLLISNEPDARIWYDPAQLLHIKNPTQIIWTRHNPGQSVKVAEQALNLLPAARLHVMEHSAHWPQWEEADEFNQVVREFLL